MIRSYGAWQESGKVCPDNSTETPLSAGATFTGVAAEVSQYSIITVVVDSDQDGTLKMQFSTDGVNWDRSKNIVIDQTIGSGSPHTLEVISKYFRVVLVNGSSNQTHLRLQTLFHVYKSGFLTSSPDEVISKINDAQLSRVSNDPILDISRGLYADKSSIHKFGFNGTVPNGSFADIWAYGPSDATYNWPTTDEAFRIRAGGNVADTAAGNGAREVTIVFLDANGDQQQESLATAGASASASTSATGRRVLRAWVSASGVYGASNTGQILIENETSGQILAAITAEFGQTQLSMYTVPLGYTAYLKRIHVDVSVGTNKDADVRMWQRPNAYTTSAPFGAKRIVRQWTAVQNDNGIVFDKYPAFPALTDLWMEAQGNGATTAVDVDYDLILVKDEAPSIPQ